MSLGLKIRLPKNFRRKAVDHRHYTSSPSRGDFLSTKNLYTSSGHLSSTSSQSRNTHLRSKLHRNGVGHHHSKISLSREAFLPRSALHTSSCCLKGYISWN